VNAAYLLLTSAWLAGADAAPAAPAPAASTPVVASGSCCGNSGGCSSCADSCGCEKVKFWDKWKGKFHKNDCGCQPTCGCAAPAPTCGCAAPVHHVHAAPSCGCAPAPSCGCDDGCGKVRLWDRMKAKFHKDCGCESSCSTCGGGCSSCGAPAAAPTGEAVPVAPKAGEAPKKMPTSTAPMTMNGIGVDATPVAAPRLDNEQEGPKHPF
jgi:hypothetical protein